MKDYIEREAFDESPIEETTALEAIDKALWMLGRRIVKNFPTADVEEVRHGEMDEKFAFRIADQFAILPSIGIIWNLRCWKWGIAFIWFRFQMRIGFKRRAKNDYCT